MSSPSNPREASPLDRRGVLAGMVLLIGLVAAYLHPFPPHFEWYHGGDCVRYLNWSRVVVDKGWKAFPLLVAEWQHRWVGFPPPTRWVYLGLVAGIMKIWTAPSDPYRPLIVISWVARLLALLPLAVWLRRLARAEVMLLSLLLVATSPLIRGMSRYPIPDELQMLTTLVLLAAMSEWLASPRRWLLVVLGATAFLLVTVRESAFLSILAAASLLLLDRREKGRMLWAPLWAMMAGCLVAVAVTIPIAGGPGPFFTLVKTVVWASLTATGNMPYVSGPPYRYLVDFMIVAPLMVVVSIAATFPLLQRPDLRRLTLSVLLPTAVLLVTHSFLPKTLRYVLTVEVGMRVLCAAAVWGLYTSGLRRGRVLALALLGGLLLTDEAVNSRLWAKDQVYDPTTFSIARQLKMIPDNR